MGASYTSKPDTYKTKLLTEPPYASPTLDAPDPTDSSPLYTANRAGKATSVTILPRIEHDADLARPTLSFRWVLLCFALTLLVYMAFVPRFLRYNSPPTGDQPFYLLDTISLVQDGDLELSNNYANLDEEKFYKLAPHPPDFVGMSAPSPLPRQLAVSIARPPEELYGFHPPGLGAMLVPAWIIGSWFALWWPATILFMCIVGALIATNIFLLAYETTGRKWVAIAVWLALSFTSPIMSYSYLIFSELPTGLVAVYAFRRLALGWKANGPLRLILVGACIGYIPWLAVRCLPIAAGLGLYAVVQWWRSFTPAHVPAANTKARLRRAWGAFREAMPENIAGTVWLLMPVVGLLTLMAAYHLSLFGSIAPIAAEREGSGVGWFYWPWMGQYELKQFITGAFGLLFSQRFGLLTFTPVYLLSIVGIRAMFRTHRPSDRRLVWWIMAVSLPYMIFIASYSSWHGDWCPPGRYASSLVPLLAAPLAMSLAALAQSKAYKVLFAALTLPGFALMAVMLYDPRTMFSGGTSAVFDWLALDVHSPLRIDMRSFIPTFTAPDTVWQPLRTGWVLVVSILLVIAGMLLLAAHSKAGSLRTLPRWSNKARFAVTAATLTLLVTSWSFINYDFLRPKTTLEYVNQWELDPSLQTNGSIAYFNSKVYIPRFGDPQGDGWLQGDVGTFDVRTGKFSRLQATTMDGQPMVWTHPSSVAVGPDGLLYVLNNGEGDRALIAMEPGGKIVRQIELDTKSVLGKGMYFDDEGNIYVADQSRGVVLVYVSTGGEPIGTYAGKEDVLNNPRGVAVDAKGNIYTTETFNRIQKLDEDGDVSAVYHLYCMPRYFAAQTLDSKWIESSCNTGIMSINTDGNYVQLAQYVGKGPRPTSPRGVTYGQNGILYIMDGANLLAYKVTH
ncbi:MAG: NHL repeat-containing protein [Chloroflexota bacterium]